MEFKPGFVRIEGTPGPEDGAWPALVASTTWNGWAVPYFTKYTARQLAAALDDAPGVQAYCDEEGDRVCVTMEDVEPPDEIFRGEDVCVERRYSVGGYSWTWTLADFEPAAG